MKLRSFLVLATIAVATLALPVSASGDNLVNTRMPFTEELFNPCTMETLTATGFVHVVTEMTLTADGSFRERHHVNMEGMTAKGLVSGVKYVVQQEENETTHIDSDGAPSTVSHRFKEHYVRAGDDGTLVLGDDFYFWFHTHITLNAQGMPTALKLDMVEEPCR